MTAPLGGPVNEWGDNLPHRPLLPFLDGSELCAQTDPDLFFPESGDEGLRQRNAKAVCRACTLRVPCLEYALDEQVAFGIWGATTPRERRDMRRRAS